MKKIILLFTIAGTIFFTSCSKDNDNPSVLLKRTIETGPDGSIETANFTYNGNKIVNSVIIYRDNIYESKYTYTGDLITKKESFNNNVLQVTDIYEYNTNGQLVVNKTIQAENSSRIYRSEYTHNANNTISVRNLMENTTWVSSSEVIYLTDGEVSKIETSYPGTNFIMVDTYTYDGKNNSAKNITGNSKIAFTNRNDPSSSQNRNRRVEGSNIISPQNVTTIIQYTYDGDNYPLTSSESQQRGTGAPFNMVSTTQYFY
ncbi:MAG TPA: hypothetical protein VF677_13375 [Flavobacterium sp.]|jgi:hypothetical protein